MRILYLKFNKLIHSIISASNNNVMYVVDWGRQCYFYLDFYKTILTRLVIEDIGSAWLLIFVLMSLQSLVMSQIIIKMILISTLKSQYKLLYRKVNKYPDQIVVKIPYICFGK